MKRRILHGIGEYDHYVRYFQISDLKITWPVSRTVPTSKNYRQSKQVAKPLLTSGLCSRHDSTIRESIQPFLSHRLRLSCPLFYLCYRLLCARQNNGQTEAFAYFSCRAIRYSDIPVFRFPVCFAPRKTNIAPFIVRYIRVTNTS